jgi:hypothetical protein
MKKLPLIITVIALGVIFLLSPFASGLYKAIITSALVSNHDIDSGFSSFKVNPLKREINITGAVFIKDDNKIEAQKIKADILSFNIFSGNYKITLNSEEVKISEANVKFMPLLEVISKQTDDEILKKAELDYINFSIKKSDKKLSIDNIEAVGKSLKVYGKIDITGKSGIGNLNLYLPAKKTEDIPDLAKILLSMEQEGDWTILKLRDIPFRIKD